MTQPPTRGDLAPPAPPLQLLRPLPDAAAEPLPLERSDCLGCAQHPATVDYLCTGCEQRIPALIDEISAGYARLDATPHGSGAGLDTTRFGGPTYGPRDGARVDVLALTTAPPAARTGAPLAPLDADERAVLTSGAAPDTSRHARERPALVPTIVALGRVADRCREDGVLPPLHGPRTVAGEALRLTSADVLADLTGRWWIGEVLDELGAAAAAIRAALGELEPTVPLGACPRQVLGEPVLIGRMIVREPRRCAGQIRSRQAGRAARCTACGHRWHGPNAVHALAGRIAEARLDVASLSAYLDGMGYGEQPAARLRKWAQLDGWTRLRIGRRTLYRLGDALASARKYRGAALGVAVLPDPAVEVGVEAGGGAA